MSDDESKLNSYPFYEFHHDHHHHHHHQTILSEGFAFPIVTDHTNFNPFMCNIHPPLQNPNQFDHINFLQGEVGYNNTLVPSNEAAAAGTSTTSGFDGGGDSIPLTPNSSASFSSQETGVEEDSSKIKKHVLQTKACEDGDGKSKNVKAKEKNEKKQRQARFAFVTKSEVDNLEDGYRWRKYGQKAVKNSSFPRSYYRCTSQKCSVKKRIERSQQDPSVVITTYEGQHNHLSPAVVRGRATAMLAPAFPQDLFFSSTTTYTQLTDSSHQPPSQISDQHNFLTRNPAVGSSFLYKPAR